MIRLADLPVVNATLNAVSLPLLIVGWVMRERQAAEEKAREELDSGD